MAAKKDPEKSSATPRRQPASTPKDREQQMIAYADALAEKQLREGTASSQVISHFLKLGSSRDQLEQEKIRHENLRLEAQVAEIQSRAKAEDMMRDLLDHMKLYMGVEDDDEE
jgi:hypothetical protein